MEILNIQNSLGDSEQETEGLTKALQTVTDFLQLFRATITSSRSASANTVQLLNWVQETSARIYGRESICLHHSPFEQALTSRRNNWHDHVLV
jgi:uncharacterized UPF0160 family protein